MKGNRFAGRTMGDKYLEPSSQKVFHLREKISDTSSKHIAKVITGEHGVSIIRERKEVWLSWDELEIILGSKPVASQ